MVDVACGVVKWQKAQTNTGGKKAVRVQAIGSDQRLLLLLFHVGRQALARCCILWTDHQLTSIWLTMPSWLIDSVKTRRSMRRVASDDLRRRAQLLRVQRAYLGCQTICMSTCPACGNCRGGAFQIIGFSYLRTAQGCSLQDSGR